MAETNPTSSAMPASDEDKKNFFAKLKHFFEEVVVLFNRNSIVQQIEQMQQELEMSMAASDIAKDTVDDLYELVNSMEGKLNTITPENVNETLDEFKGKYNDVLENDSKMKKVYRTNYHLKDRLNELSAFAIADSEKDFLSEAKIISSNKLNKNQYLIKFNDELFTATASISEISDSERRIEFNIDKYSGKQSDIFDNHGNLKDGCAYAEKIDGNAEHVLASAVCAQNNLKYIFDVEKEKARVEVKMTPRQKFLKEHIEKPCLSEDGRYESQYFNSDGSFRIRDRETGDTMCFKSTKNEVEIYLCRDTESLKDKNAKEAKIGSWKDNGKGCLSARMAFVDAETSMLLHSDESERWLGFNGITREQLTQACYHDTDTDWQKVEGKEARQRVESLKEACTHAIGNKKLVAQIRNGKNDKFTFVNISPRLAENDDASRQPRLSFTFDSDGMPQTINYKQTNGKAKFVYNLKTKNVSSEYKQLRSDATFQSLYATACEALDSLGLDTTIKHTETRNLDEAYCNEAIKNFSFVPITQRNLDPDAYRWEEHDREDAIHVNAAAFYAIKKGKISAAQIEKVANCDRETANDIMKSLVNMNIVTEQGRKAEAAMTISEYAALTTSLASNRNAREALGEGTYTAYLVDAYSESLKHMKQEKANKIPEGIEK